MARPLGTKNKMRSAKDKEAIVEEYLNSRQGIRVIAKIHEVSCSSLTIWIKKYKKEGIIGFESKTGKHGKERGNPITALYTSKSLSEIDRLKLELVKKEIEIERLKKGYEVKGVGSNKEFIILNDVNLKS